MDHDLGKNGASGAHLLVEGNLIVKIASGAEKKRLSNEVEWLNNLPLKLKKHFPNIVYSYSCLEFSLVYLELVEAEDMAVQIFKPDVDEDFICDSFDRALEILKDDIYVSSCKSASRHWRVLLNQVEDRLSSIDDTHEDIVELLSYDEIYVNGERLSGYNETLNRIKNHGEYLDGISSDKSYLIHGDVHTGNILAAKNSVTFLDPRGKFGTDDVLFDLAYDGGKILHDFHGKYNYINSGNSFYLHRDTNHYNFKIYDSRALRIYDKLLNNFVNVGALEISKCYQDKNFLERSLVFEGLLFLSLIPFHIKDVNKATAFILNSMIILNRWLRYVESSDLSMSSMFVSLHTLNKKRN